MKKIVALLLMLCLISFSIGETQMQEKEQPINQTYATICASWGKPTTSWVNLYIWNDTEKGYLIGMFENDNDEKKLKSYMLFSNEEELISGTIPNENTARHLLNLSYETFANDVDLTIDIGSGLSIPAQISADGYVVYYIDQEAHLYNCFSSSYENVLLFKIRKLFTN